jgi:hypothetical protein
VATVRSPESAIGSNYGDDRIEKPASFVNDVREPFVMGIGEIPLKGGWFHGVDRQDRKQ